MIMLVLYLLVIAATLACLVLLLMDQIYLIAVIEAVGVVILTCVLVREGRIGMFEVGAAALCVGVPGLCFLLGVARRIGGQEGEFKVETRGIPDSPVARSRGTND